MGFHLSFGLLNLDFHTVKVIFKKTNKVQDVSFGYAVNYLIPQGLAVVAYDEELKRRKEKEKQVVEEKVKKATESTARATKLKGREFVIKKKAGKTGKLYGALGKKELAESLGVEKKEIVLKEPIKKTGEYQIGLKIGEEKVKVKIKVIKKLSN